MDRQRRVIEDATKVGKRRLGWEDARVLALDRPEVRPLIRLGGGEPRATRPPGKPALTRGPRRPPDHLATEAILAAELQQHGSLPPRLAAPPGRPSGA